MEAVMDRELGEAIDKAGVWWEEEPGMEGITVFSVLTRIIGHVEKEYDGGGRTVGEETCRNSG
jgi:hypothetical protein